MKTKAYLLIGTEILAIRDALEELYFQTKDLKPNSPIAIERNKAVKALYDQFKDDYRKM